MVKKTFIAVTISNQAGKTSATLNLPVECGIDYQFTGGYLAGVNTLEKFNDFCGTVVNHDKCLDQHTSALNALYDWTELSFKLGFRVQVMVKLV